MLELLLLLIILGSFGYGIFYFSQKENEKTEDDQNLDLVFIISIVLVSSAFVFGIIFSDKFINFLKSGSKLASIGLLLAKIKSFFIGGKEEKQINQAGGSIPLENTLRENDIYDDEDDLPDSDDDEDYLD